MRAFSKHRVDRLGQVVLGAHLDALDHAVELVERRRHDHRDVAEMRVELQLRQHLVTVELGHQDVEQHQVEVLATQQVERLAAVLREGDGVPLLLQTAAEQKAVHPVVVGDQDRSGREAEALTTPAVERSAARASSSGSYSCSIRSTSSEAPSSSPFLARCSSSRQSSEKRSAPERRAVRLQRVRRSTELVRVLPRRRNVRSIARSIGASARKASITSARNSSPPSSFRFSSACGVEVGVDRVRARRHAFSERVRASLSASRSSFGRIGFAT